MAEPEPAPIVEEPVALKEAEVSMTLSESLHEKEEAEVVDELKNESSLQIPAEKLAPEVPSENASEECKVVNTSEAVPTIKPPKQDDSSDGTRCTGKDRSQRQNMILREIPPCPVFEPTLEEFENISFEDYVQKAESTLDRSIGCFKVSIIYSKSVLIAITFITFVNLNSYLFTPFMTCRGPFTLYNSLLLPVPLLTSFNHLQVVAPEGWQPTTRNYDDFKIKINCK